MSSNPRRRFLWSSGSPARPALFAAALAALALAAPASHIAGIAAGQYVLSGSPDGTGTFIVDDKLEIFLNGQLIYTDPVPGRGSRQPIPFMADVGDQLRFVVNDTVLPVNGACPGLSTIYLVDPQGKSTVATPGFYIGCPSQTEEEGPSPKPGQGLVFDTTFTIPDVSASGSSYREVAIDSAFAGPLLLNGFLYGVTYDGGNGSGTIYRAAPDLSQLTTLYAFPGNGQSGQVGVPYDELTPGGKGFFGTTSDSVNGGGAIFEFDISTNTITYLFDVSWFASGALSGSLLVTDGYLYGSLRGFNASKIFRIRSDGSSTDLEILHTFDDSEGRGPGGLTFGPDGYLYGTAHSGGNFNCYPNGCGTVFRLRPDGQDFSVLHVFNTFLGHGDESADSFPQRRLVLGSDNRLYGTTYRGVFSLAAAPAPADFKVIYALGNQDGSQIFAPPAEGSDGRIYIAQYDGGIDLFGAVYSMTKSGTNVVMHHQFGRNGQAFLPYGQLTVDGAGTIYGTTEYSDATPDLGRLFAIRTIAGNNQPPIASATAPASVTAAATCEASVQLNGSGSSDPNGDALTYSWTENGVQIATGATPTVQLGVGTHTIRLTVTDPANATAFDDVTVTVTNATTVTYIGPSILQSQGNNVLEASVTGASGPIAGAEIIFTVNGTPFQATSDGAGIARVTIGGVAGSSAVIQIDYPAASCGGATQTVTRLVNRWPTVSPSGPSPVFAGANCMASVALAANASDLDGDTLTYVWSEGGATFSTVANPTASLAPGIHTIDVAVADGNGGTASGSVVIDVRKALIGLAFAAPLPQFTVGVPASVSARLSDISDAPIAGASLAFTLTGSSVNATTDANGIATVSLTPSSNGIQELTVSYAGDTCRSASTFRTNVTVALPTATVVVTTVVTNDNGGSLSAADFTTTVLAPSANPSTFAGSATGVIVTVGAGSYQVVQPGRPEYVTTMSTECTGTIAGGETRSCTITNNDKPTTLTLNKQVINDNGGAFQPAAWTLHANGVPFTQGQATPVAPGQYALGESGPGGYTPSAWNCVGGSLNGSTLTIAPNTEVSCTIANDDQPATLTLTKFVQNDNGGTRSASDWQLTANGQIFLSGISQTVGAGSYLLGESGPGGYAPSGWGCTGSGSLTGSTLTLAPGQAASCSITNDDIAPGNSTITQIGPGTGSVGSLLLTATLRDSATGQPLSGRTLIFILGNQITAAPTDFRGVATAPLTLAQAPGRLTLTVTFAGDNVYAPAQATRSFEVVIDTDGDGLPDSWETNGVDLTGDGTIDLPLPAMGANPLRKDVFVEVDWMVKPSACVWLVCWTNGGVLQPQRVVLDTLVARFAAAPVTNPDGSTGISLHVDGGPDTIMNPMTGEPWGAFSRAGVVPYDPSLGAVTPDGEYDWSEFDALKQAFLEPARRPVFHYAIYADVLAAINAGGISRGITAADFIVAAGHPDWNGGLTTTQEASLFIHELGHNLGLRHGGGDDLNNKPNYLSSLNYLWTLVGVPPDNRADYSSVVEPPIDETVTGVDVNDDGRLTTLTGFLDWPNLVYTGGGIGDLFAQPPPPTTPVDPIDPVEMRQRGIYARDGDGLIHFRGPSVLVRDSGVRSLTIDVKNVSAVDASYTVSAESAIVAGGVSAAASVPAGSLVQVTLPVDTTGLAPGEYAVSFTLRSDTGEILHRQPAVIVVIDLSVPENLEAARAAMAALATLPPDSGLDPDVLEQITGMFEEAMPSWVAEVRVSGRVAFDAVYRIEDPAIPDNPGRFIVQSLPDTPLLVLDIMRAGKAVNGTIRLQPPTGEPFDARIAGRWDESTRTFDGVWIVDGDGRGGSITFRLQEP